MIRRRPACRLLFLFVLAVLVPIPTWAASCCGGGSTSDGLSLAKYHSWGVGVVVTEELAWASRNDQGAMLGSGSWRSRDSRLSIAGAYRLGENWQTNAIMPLVMRSIRLGNISQIGVGFGDIKLQLRYEIIDEETCYARPVYQMSWFDLKPSVHWVTDLGTPSGRTVAEASGLGADATGAGEWYVDTGLEVTKVWGRWGNSGFVKGGFESMAPRSNVTRTALRLQMGAGAQLYFKYRQFVSLGLSHSREYGVGASKEAPPVSRTGLSTLLSMIFPKMWLIRASVGSSSLLQGRNSPVSVSANFMFGRLFY